MSLKIFPTGFGYRILAAAENNQDKNKNSEPSADAEKIKCVGLASKYNDYLLSFGARVDKGLERFYDANKDRMPVPVRRYVENLSDKTQLTPLEAQKRAFSSLNDAITVEDIKKSFSNEHLFDKLIEPSESKARRGIIASFKENEELLALSNQGMLKSNENFTVYLVKKVFLEAKTIDEINNDLEKDLDEDFKADFRFKNPDSQYVYGTTLKALGIETPDADYQQSLRYTRNGYSDMVGEKIAEGRNAFFDSLDDDERFVRAKKSVEKIENWWNSLSKNQKLDMIAEQMSFQDMLKNYKKYRKTIEKQNSAESEKTGKNTESQKTRKHVKVGSATLSQDELFIKWATNNLKNFEATLSEADKDTLHIKSMQRLVSRWANMSPVERTDYISKMKAGSEPLRYTMIDAWNHSVDLIKDLSVFLKANQIYKPADMLYSTQEFSQFQSQLMTEFWQNHADYSVQLGDSIIRSQEKIKDAISRGTFEELKKQIMRDKNQRIKEMEKFKTETKTDLQSSQLSAPDEPEYKKSFKDAYNAHVYGKINSMPKKYYNDLYNTVLSELPEEAVRAWTKNLKNELLTDSEIELIQKYVATEFPSMARFNRAIEAAIADTLYEFTKDASVYEMSNSDVKVALYHLERGDNPIALDSHKVGQRFILNVQKKGRPNPQRINNLYESYKQDLSNEELAKIFHSFFEVDKSALLNSVTSSIISVYDAAKIRNEFNEYLNSYGKSALILFSDKSTYPVDVKNAFNRKFLANMPKSLKEQEIIKPLLNDKEDIKNEQKIAQAKFLFGKRFPFLTQDILSSYFSEVAVSLRSNKSGLSADDFIKYICTKRLDAKTNAKMAILPKQNMQAETKLKLLAFEQAMADVLYESTGSDEVYSLSFEALCDNLELFSMVKKFPTAERTFTQSPNDKNITLSAKSKPNLSKLNRLYAEYMDEIVDWMNNDVKEQEKADYEQLLFILNPDENNLIKDKFVSKRMSTYGFNVENFTNLK